MAAANYSIPSHLLSEIRNGQCVAFIGAGFSAAAGLPSWGDLLRNIVAKARVDELFQPGGNTEGLIKYLQGLIDSAGNNPENYDMCAQILEDELGKKQVSILIKECLKLQSPLPEVMKERLRLLKGIPFKAVLTTNFDLLLHGETPSNEPPYDTILRFRNQNSTSAFSQDDFESADHGSSENTDSKTTDSRMPWPVVKIHGCVESPATMVWTRTGYRALINEVPGYIHFLRTLLATSTVLYIGFSFSDGYLNEVRGEVLSMLYGHSSGSSSGICGSSKLTSFRGIHDAGRCGANPLGYAIVHDKEANDIEYFRLHEGVQILTWQTRSSIPNTPRDFGGLDRYLRNVYTLTSSSYYLGKLTWGHKILMLMKAQIPEDPTEQQTARVSFAVPASTAGGEDKAAEDQTKASKANTRVVKAVQETRRQKMRDLTLLLNASMLKYQSMRKLVDNSGSTAVTNSAIVYTEKAGDNGDKTLELTLEELKGKVSAVDASSRDYPDGGAVHVVHDDCSAVLDCMRLVQYDLVVTVYGWRPHNASSMIEEFVTGMRQLPIQNQAPFIVTTTKEDLAAKRTSCFKMGAVDVVTNFDELVNSVTRLLKKMKDSSKLY